MNKRILTWLIGIIVVLVIAYFAANYFISRKVDNNVKQIVTQLQRSPNVKSLSYQKVQVSVFDLLTHKVTVKGIRVVFKQAPEQPILIDQMAISHYQQSASGVPLTFDISVQGLKLTSLQRALTGIVKTYQHRQQQPGSPIIILLNKPAEVAIVKSKHDVLWHGHLAAGKHDIDTRHFPAGTYEVTVITQPVGSKADGHKQLFVKSEPHNVALPMIDKYVPKGSVLSADLTLQYNAHKTQLNTSTRLYWQGQEVASQTSTLHPFQIERRVTNLQAVAEAIEHTFVEKIDSHINVHFTLPVPKNNDHFVWQNIRALGYQSLPVSVVFNGKLDAKTGQILNQGQVSIAKAGTLNWDGKTLMGKQRSLGQAWFSMMHPEKTNLQQELAYLPKIVSEQLTYQDHSLATRVMDLVAKRTHQTPAQIQQSATAMLSVLTEKFAIPQVQTTIKAIETFLAKPNKITFALKPKTPFSLHLPQQFAEHVQKQNKALAQQLALAPQQQRQALQAEHDKQLYEQISTLLDRMGYQAYAH